MSKRPRQSDLDKRLAKANALANPGVVPPSLLGVVKAPKPVAIERAVRKLPRNTDPNWIEAMPPGKNRDRVVRFYRLTRAELKATGRVSPARDAMLRQLAWYADILDRVERAIAKTNGQGRTTLKPEAMTLIKWYSQLSREMLALAKELGVDLAPRRQTESRKSEAWRVERVTYPQEERDGADAD